MGWLTEHYGLDVVAGVLMLVSLWRLGERRRDGLLWAAGAAVFWVAFNVKVDSPPGVVINVLIGGLSVRSWWRWKGQEGEAEGG